MMDYLGSLDSLLDWLTTYKKHSPAGLAIYVIGLQVLVSCCRDWMKKYRKRREGKAASH